MGFSPRGSLIRGITLGSTLLVFHSKTVIFHIICSTPASQQNVYASAEPPLKCMLLHPSKKVVTRMIKQGADPSKMKFSISKMFNRHDINQKFGVNDNSFVGQLFR